MAIQTRDQSIKWVMLEERESEPGELAARWWQLSLDTFPPGLDYLVLECSYVASPRIACGWLDLSAASLGVSLDRLGDMEAEEVKALGQEVLALRRRRDRALPGWKARYQVATNRSNRVAQRMMKLIEENAYV
jgi:hypothetical protein